MASSISNLDSSEFSQLKQILNERCDFGIPDTPPFVSVTHITGFLPFFTVGTSLFLSGTVNPLNADHQTIVWSIVRQGDIFDGTQNIGAVLIGNELTATTPGTVAVRATIVDGRAPGVDFVQEFTVFVLEVFVPVTNITGVPATTSEGVVQQPVDEQNNPLPDSIRETPLTCIIHPQNAFTAFRSIPRWELVSSSLFRTETRTEMELVDEVQEDGTVITRLEEVTREVQVRVTSGILIVTNPTNSFLIIPDDAFGSVVMRVTVFGGALGGDYTQDFTIFSVEHVAPSRITGIPPAALNGVSAAISYAVLPSSAVLPNPVEWTVVDADGTGAVIVTGINTIALHTDTGTSGLIRIRATIEDGVQEDVDFVQEFDIFVNDGFVPVTDIAGVLGLITGGTPTLLEGRIVPVNATNRAITGWQVLQQSFGSGTSITNGNVLNTVNPGVARVRGIIADGTAVGTAYTQDFDLRVFVPVSGIQFSYYQGTYYSTFYVDLYSGTVQPTTSRRPINWSNWTNSSGNWTYWPAIIWSLVSTTGAVKVTSLSGNRFYYSGSGEVVVRATIENGLGFGRDWMEDFTVDIA